MSRRKRSFDVVVPDLPTNAPSAPERRRGPMASAIREATGTLNERARVEAEIRAENDALARELVRLRDLGMVIETLPLDAVRTDKLVRDRRPGAAMDLDDLKRSIREVGLSNPIRVEADGQGGYELVEGMRRLTAYRELAAADDAFAAIPAAVIPAGQTAATLYRRMVDENMVRAGVSFAEMAMLARHYAAEGTDGCGGVDEAVNHLYASAPAQKRSYIRRFAALMEAVGPSLARPEAIPRALGLAVVDRLDAEPAAAAGLRAALAAGSGDERDVLRRFAEGASAPARRRGAPRRRVELDLPDGGRLIAGPGRVEMRLAHDFRDVPPERLAAAAAAFRRVLEG